MRLMVILSPPRLAPMRDRADNGLSARMDMDVLDTHRVLRPAAEHC